MKPPTGRNDNTQRFPYYGAGQLLNMTEQLIFTDEIWVQDSIKIEIKVLRCHVCKCLVNAHQSTVVNVQSVTSVYWRLIGVQIIYL